MAASICDHVLLWARSEEEMINALCIDLEHWWCSEFLTQYLPQKKEDQIVESVMPILELLDKYETKATFFILGTVAEQHPEIVESICDKGNEIASHGYSHKTLYELGKEGFEEEIKKSVALLEAMTGEKPIGFRAPSFSIDNSTKWAFEVLTKYGFKYDASIFPVRTMLYGVPKAPLHPYRPSMDDITEENPNGEIIEFPMTVLKLGINIPVAGGFYLRVLPFWFVRWALRRINKERPAIIYIHPWETYPKTPRLKNIPAFSKFVTYYGIDHTLQKFQRLLQEFKFAPVREVLGITAERNGGRLGQSRVF